MKIEIKRLFEMLTWQFLNAFLSQCPQDAPPFPTPALPNPTILPSGLPGTGPIHLTWRNFSGFILLLFLNILHTTYYILSSRVSPILRANHPILPSSHPILLSNHPILRGNHPRVSAWGPLLQALCTARLPSTSSGPEFIEGSSPKSVHFSLFTA